MEARNGGLTSEGSRETAARVLAPARGRGQAPGRPVRRGGGGGGGGRGGGAPPPPPPRRGWWRAPAPRRPPPRGAARGPRGRKFWWCKAASGWRAGARPGWRAPGSWLLAGPPAGLTTGSPTHAWAASAERFPADPLPDAGVTPAGLACFIYTAGTTGPSK